MRNNIFDDSELKLVAIVSGLSAKTFAPGLRPHMVESSNSSIMDDIHMERAKTGTFDHRKYAPYIATLEEANRTSTIRGGYAEDNKGLLRMTFLMGSDSGYETKYYHVLGVITGNNTSSGLSTTAIFLPMYSWVETRQCSSSVGLDGRATTVSKLSERKNIFYLDGSEENENNNYAVSPSAMLTTAANQNLLEDYRKSNHVFSNADCHSLEHGLHVGPQTHNFNTMNPIEYMSDVLEGLKLASVGSHSTHTENIEQVASFISNDEPNIVDDPFMRSISTVGFRQCNSVTIDELINIYTNFEELYLYHEKQMRESLKGEHIEYVDYRLNTRSLESNTPAIRISACILDNALDLVTKHGLSKATVMGSTIVNGGGMGYLADDSGNPGSDVIVQPYGGCSLIDNDFNIGSRLDRVCFDIKNQIMRSLVGYKNEGRQFVKFVIEMELFGVTKITISVHTHENPEPLPFEYVYPTYACTRFSPIFMNDVDKSKLGNVGYYHLYSHIAN